MAYHKSPEDRLKHIAVSVRVETLEVIEEIAKREDTSRARVGRQLILRGIEATQQEKKAPV